ncbi:hypothetical protein K469DRAFT_385410 [Zopfia rhizophila CBS 207.26]|uniref:Uncharacterized protein n=1 Tax=Zopfia rhizophila CBS 207.26 TaxID=1314779 RepID=A0A6A6EIE3_9PEZI|nr:hypothetical protein K469DRAFT_385410 [Zopfia rhizophila CBS 207.26]
MPLRRPQWSITKVSVPLFLLPHGSRSSFATGFAFDTSVFLSQFRLPEWVDGLFFSSFSVCSDISLRFLWVLEHGCQRDGGGRRSVTLCTA